MNPGRRAIRVIHSVAPIRICDNGGWTDTWFARHGKVFNIGVHPCVEVQLEVFPHAAGQDHIILCAENYGQCYAVRPRSSTMPGGWGPHPLLEAAIERVGVPADCAVQVTVYSAMPGGGSTGTSAAVTVALIGALSYLGARQWSPHQIAYEAHAVEVDMLRQQSGIQDQLCAAYGGINFIDIPRYPEATVSPLQVPDPVLWELERRLVLIYLGKAHDSSRVHEQVIAGLQNEGPESRRLQDLRLAAEKARDAVLAGDFAALGRAMIENTEAQGRLHSHLISADAQRVIEIARDFGAAGWKVNGAGGEGGSVTLLCPELSHTKRQMLCVIKGANLLFKNIPIQLSRYGLCVWESDPLSSGQSM